MSVIQWRCKTIAYRARRVLFGICAGAILTILPNYFETVAANDIGMLENATASAGKRAPNFLLMNLDHLEVRLSDFHGTPVVMNFFASWCGPCLTELPLLQTAHAEAADRGYVVLGVATQDNRGAVELLADEFALTFPILIDGDNSVGRAYRVIGPPYTFFIDADGIVIDVVPGAMEQEVLNLHLGKLLAMNESDAA